MPNSSILILMARIFLVDATQMFSDEFLFSKVLSGVYWAEALVVLRKEIWQMFRRFYYKYCFPRNLAIRFAVKEIGNYINRTIFTKEYLVCFSGAFLSYLTPSRSISLEYFQFFILCYCEFIYHRGLRRV